MRNTISMFVIIFCMAFNVCEGATSNEIELEYITKLENGKEYYLDVNMNNVEREGDMLGCWTVAKDNSKNQTTIMHHYINPKSKKFWLYEYRIVRHLDYKTVDGAKGISDAFDYVDDNHDPISLVVHRLNYSPVILEGNSFPSRYIFDMKDQDGKKYTVHIFSKDEKKGHDWIWKEINRTEHPIYSGNYSVYLKQDGMRKGMEQQNLNLFPALRNMGDELQYGYFDLADPLYRNAVYKIDGEKGEPDILVVAQQQTGSGHTGIKVFSINKGEMSLVKWKTNNNIEKGTIIYAKPLKKIGFKKYKTYDYLRNPEFFGWLEETWDFDSEQNMFIVQSSKLYKK